MLKLKKNSGVALSLRRKVLKLHSKVSSAAYENKFYLKKENSSVPVNIDVLNDNFS